jgi:DNA-binding response OmpR family regulator
MPRRRILIVEDEARTAEFYQAALRRAGYAVACARTSAQALKSFKSFTPDLVLLDLKLDDDDLDGFDVLADIRKRQQDNQVHIVILTGQPGEERLLRGYRLGADNYLQKPVSEAQLVARVEAHLRRRTPRCTEIGSRIVHYGDLTINLEEGRGTRNGRRVTFGDVEQRILARLLRTPGDPVRHEELMQIGWGRPAASIHNWEDMRALLSCIYRLRDKLESRSSRRRIIRTIPNVGFAIAPPDRSEEYDEQ